VAALVVNCWAFSALAELPPPGGRDLAGIISSIAGVGIGEGVLMAIIGVLKQLFAPNRPKP
jgi:hypothetical protein